MIPNAADPAPMGSRRDGGRYRFGRAVQWLAMSPRFGRIAPHFIPQIDRFLHRISGGRIMLNDILMPGVLLTTTGAVSGLPRETPLLAIPLDGDLYVVG